MGASRADLIIAAITAELNHRRAELDAGDALTSVSLVLYLHRKTSLPRELVFRTESARAVEVADRCAPVSLVHRDEVKRG